MKRLLFLLAILFVVFTQQSYAADAHRDFWPGWYTWDVTQAMVKARVTYTGQSAGQVIYIRRVIDGSGGFSFTATGESGVYESSPTGYLATGPEGTNTIADWTAVLVTAAPNSTISGGRPITGLVVKNGCDGSNYGSPCHEPTVNNHVNMNYTVTGPTANCNVTFNFTTSNFSSDPYYTNQGMTAQSLSYKMVETLESGSEVTAFIAGEITANGLPQTISRSEKVSDMQGRVIKIRLQGALDDGTSYLTMTMASTIPCGTVINESFNGPFPAPPATPTPAPTVSPTPSATPTPTQPAVTPSPTPTGPSTPPPNLGEPTTGGEGDIRVTNPQDIYKPIVDRIELSDNNRKKDLVDALNQAGSKDNNQNHGPKGIDAGFAVGTQPSGVTSNVGNTALNTSMGNANTRFTESSSNAVSKIESIQPLALPTTALGNKMTWALTLPMLGALTIDLTPYQATITLMRSLLLMVMMIGAWFATIKIIRSGIA